MTGLAVITHAHSGSGGSNGATVIALIIAAIILKRAFSHGKWNR